MSPGRVGMVRSSRLMIEYTGGFGASFHMMSVFHVWKETTVLELSVTAPYYRSRGCKCRQCSMFNVNIITYRKYAFIAPFVWLYEYLSTSVVKPLLPRQYRRGRLDNDENIYST